MITTIEISQKKMSKSSSYVPAKPNNRKYGYGLETGTAAELRLALTIILTLTDTEFAVQTLLLGYRRR